MTIITNLQAETIIFGFDSAWTDNPKAPGAICAIAFEGNGRASFIEPRLVSFDGALEFVEAQRQGFRFGLLALDQPTIVPNMSGCRPVERAAASLISYVGGGVQPANRSKTGMFCDSSPIWRFKTELGAVEEPEAARSACDGMFLIEVFPALALPGLHPAFAGRLKAPKYNLGNRKRFRVSDWETVAATVGGLAAEFEIPRLASWAAEVGRKEHLRKADQDLLDATICALVGLIWRACDRTRSVMLGDTKSGYMIAPVSPETRSRLAAGASRQSVRCV